MFYGILDKSGGTMDKPMRQATEEEVMSFFVKISIEKYGKEWIMDNYNLTYDEIDKALNLYYSLDLASIHL